MIEKAYFIRDLADLKAVTSVDRVYIGSDHCIKAFPDKFNFLINKLKLSFKINLLIPPILESELSLLEKYLKMFINIADEDDEIILNDLGALKLVISTEDRKFKVGLGRYFSYQKRGVQNLYGMVEHKDLRDIPILEKETVMFLKNIGVDRVEIDATYYGLNIPEDVDIKISLYENNLLTSYSINCPHTFNGRYWGRRCKRECLSAYASMSSEETISPIFLLGKAYYQNTEPSKSEKVDRIVRFQWKIPS